MKILIVEDDRAAAETIRDGLQTQSHTVEIAEDGSGGSFLGRSYMYDAIVLDHALPGKNGLAVCREIRAAGKSTPIIFLSVTSDLETKVAAFGHGADDYMTKPFSMTELSARLKAIVRRPAGLSDRTILEISDVVLDIEKRTVSRGGKYLSLTRKEFGLLEYFMHHPGVVLSRVLLMEHVWTAENDPFSNTVEAHIRNLRKKLNAGNRPNLIANIPGRGYVMDAPPNLKKF